MERLTKKISKTVQDKYSLGSYLQYDFANADDINKLLNKLGKFEDFMEEQGFESLEDLKDSYETIKKSQASTHSTLMTINEELVKARQIIARHTIENQALKERWEKLKDYVNTPKEFQEWREEMEITVDSIKNKIQELEK